MALVGLGRQNESRSGKGHWGRRAADGHNASEDMEGVGFPASPGKVISKGEAENQPTARGRRAEEMESCQGYTRFRVCTRLMMSGDYATRLTTTP